MVAYGRLVSWSLTQPLITRVIFSLTAVLGARHPFRLALASESVSRRSHVDLSHCRDGCGAAAWTNTCLSAASKVKKETWFQNRCANLNLFFRWKSEYHLWSQAAPLLFKWHTFCHRGKLKLKNLSGARK